MLNRPLYRHIFKELSKEKRMVFLSGARRVGKTTLGELIGEGFLNQDYLSWEIPQDRTRLIRSPPFSKRSNAGTNRCRWWCWTRSPGTAAGANT